MKAIVELPNETRGWIIGKQLGRPATSIGANVWEADGALTESDFVHKISIARKEAIETEYWLQLVLRMNLIPRTVVDLLLCEASEIAKILGSIVRKTQEHIHRG